MTQAHPLKVSIRHREIIVSAGLAALLAACPGIEVADDAELVVTDYADAMARLQRGGGPAERIMIVTQREREWDVRMAISAGAHGYLPQQCDAEELQAALRTIGGGERYFNKELLARAAQHLSQGHFTLRESEVLKLLAQGYSNKLIARQMDIGVGTVKSHVKSVFGKLGARARTHAVVLATQRGIVSN
jgi:DNA-binding NarL/FixJ family response regulator